MKPITRRAFLAGSAVSAATVLAGCAPQVVEKIVKETVPVKETVQVEKVVKEVITPTPVAKLGDLPYQANDKAKGRVRFWNGWGGTRIPIMTEMINGFHKLYPGIQIESLVLNTNDLTTKFLTAVAGGDPPEVIMLMSNDLPKLVGGNALRALDEQAGRDSLKLDRYYPAEIGARKLNGKLYLLPQVSALTNSMLFCNKKVMQEEGIKAPKTWQELTEASKKITKTKDGKITRNAIYPVYNKELDLPPFVCWLTANNGQFISPAGDKMLFNSQEGLDTLKYLVELSDINLDKRPEDLLPADPAEYREGNQKAFINNQLAFLIEGSWMFSQFAALGMPIDAYELAAVPFNGANPKAKAGAPSYGGWGFGIPALLKDAEAAWEWVKYSCYGPASGAFTKAQVRPNPVKEYNEDPDLQKNPHWKTMMELMGLEVSITATEAYPRQRELLRDMTWNALYHKQEPEAALEACAKACQAELDKIQKK